MIKNLLCFFALLIGISGSAQWNPDPTVNNPIVTTAVSTASKDGLVSTSDLAGNVWIGWIETRGATSTDLYVQKVLADGTVAFAPGGVIVCNATGAQSALSITPDGTGGVIASWTDARDATTFIYAQRINAMGVRVWADNGIRCTGGSATQNGALISLLNATDFAIVWRDQRDALSLDLYTNIYTISTGAAKLATDLQIVSQANSQTSQQIMADGLGGYFVVWTDGRVANAQSGIYAQYINNAGVKQWVNGGDNQGFVVSFVSGFNSLAPSLTLDGAGGIVVAWADLRNGTTNADIFSQRVDATGTNLWTANGVSLCAAPNSQTNALVVRSGTNFIYTWSDPRVATSNTDIYATAVNGNGAIVWPTANGERITDVTGNQPNSAASGFSLFADGSNGAVIIWDDARNSSTNIDVMAQRLTSAGAISWAANGTPVATKTGSNQNQPTATIMSTGRIFVGWRDSRSGSTSAEIFGSVLLADGTLPLTLTKFGGTQRPNAIDLNWETSNERNTREFVVEKSADGTNFAPIGSVKAQNKAGNFNYALTDIHPLNGYSFYRLRLVDIDGKLGYSSIIRFNLGTLQTGSMLLLPNPAKQSFQLQFRNIETGNYTARLSDVNGKLVSKKLININTSFLQTSWNINDLPAGIYMLVLENATGKALHNSKLVVE